MAPPMASYGWKRHLATRWQHPLSHSHTAAPSPTHPPQGLRDPWACLSPRYNECGPLQVSRPAGRRGGRWVFRPWCTKEGERSLGLLLGRGGTPTHMPHPSQGQGKPRLWDLSSFSRVNVTTFGVSRCTGSLPSSLAHLHLENLSGLRPISCSAPSLDSPWPPSSPRVLSP